MNVHNKSNDWHSSEMKCEDGSCGVYIADYNANIPVLNKDIETEEEKLEIQNKEEEELRLKEERERADKESSEQRYKRLMHLLTKSQFYSQFLYEKVKSHQQTSQAKKPRKNKFKTDDKENTSLALNKANSQGSSSQSSCNSDESTSHRRKRTLKRRNEDQCKVTDIIDAETVEAHMSKAPVEGNEPLFQESQPRLFENGVMRPYQLDGFSWLKVIYENGINGILADEMGLGKTIQCIAVICHLIDKGVPGPFLVVAPLSTLPNWLSEFERFAPKIPTILYHGPEVERAKMRPEFLRHRRIETCEHPVAPVVVTSYSITIKDRNKLNNVFWRYVVVDEGHRIKNYKCQLARCLSSFTTTNRLLLTGTPLQNNLSELWSLLNFLMPEIFDSLDVFESWFEIGDMMDDDSDEKIIQQEREKQILSMLHKILNPFLLRRVKADVDLQIPAKKELLVYTPMTPLQVELYKATLTKDHSFFKQNVNPMNKVEYDSKGRPVRSARKPVDYRVIFDDSETDESFEQFLLEASKVHTREPSKVSVERTSSMNLTWRNIMMQCRKVVNHPYLIQYPLTPERDFKIDEDILKCCGKLQVLDQLLQELHTRGHKVLLFSQMARVLDIIEDFLTLRPQIRYKRLDGSVGLAERRKDIKEFNEENYYFLYLLTTRAGGLGINLTSADTVIIYDSDWNPQQDIQAQDRCHRIGQVRPVLILRFVTASTIDQKIIERASAKRKLEKMIMKKGLFTSSVLQEQDLKELVDPEELLKLLQSRDHQRIHKASTGSGIYTQKELDQLLDRSDLVMGKNKTQKNNEQLEGVFKVVMKEECT